MQSHAMQQVDCHSFALDILLLSEIVKVNGIYLHLPMSLINGEEGNCHIAIFISSAFHGPQSEWLGPRGDANGQPCLLQPRTFCLGHD